VKEGWKKSVVWGETRGLYWMDGKKRLEKRGVKTLK